MCAKRPCHHVRWIAAELFADGERKTRGIEHAAHAHQAIAGQSRLLIRKIGHDIERIGDADIDGIGRILDSLIDDRRHDARVHAEQVFARHARLASDARGDDHHIGIGSRSIVVRARNTYRELLDRTHVHHIERLALWQTFGHIDQDHIGEILACDDMCCSRADVTCTNDGYLTHDSLLESFNFCTYSDVHIVVRADIPAATRECE